MKNPVSRPKVAARGRRRGKGVERREEGEEKRLVHRSVRLVESVESIMGLVSSLSVSGEGEEFRSS